jgi:hypothetical protein
VQQLVRLVLHLALPGSIACVCWITCISCSASCVLSRCCQSLRCLLVLRLCWRRRAVFPEGMLVVI